MAKIFALLAAINEYESKPLRGCIADVDSVEVHLRERAAKEQKIEIRVLKNAQATRQAIVEGFQTYLTNAGPQDTAVFYFAGHGSQQACPPELWDREPDHLNETIVCFDSRLPGGTDLADKELAVLVAHVAERNPHILVVLDSCHSGSGTRGTDGAAVRSLPARRDPPPAGSFLATARSISRGIGSGWSRAPEGRHLLMAACRADQQAWECVESGQIRGAFSLSLAEALESISPNVTNQALFQSVRSAVQRRIPYQDPQLEANVAEDLDLPFLGGALNGRAKRFFVNYGREGWLLNAGQIHGVPIPRMGDAARFALFPMGSSQEGQSIVARATVRQVGPASSLVDLNPPQDRSSGFEATLEHLPIPPTIISVEGDPGGVTLVLKEIECQGQHSLPFAVEISDRASFRLIATPECYELREAQSKYLLCTPVLRNVGGAEGLVIENIKHIVRWHQARDLRNCSTSIPDADFEVALLLNGEELKERPVCLEYGPGCKSVSPPGFQVRMKNLGRRDLYVGLLALSELFGIEPLLPEGSVKIAPDQEAYAMNGRLLQATVPEEFLHQDRRVVCDHLMAIVCTTEFDATLLRQGKLGMAAECSSGPSLRASPTSLHILLNQIQKPERGVAKESAHVDDWTVRTVQVTTVQKRPYVSISTSEVADLGLGIKIQPHSGLAASARLGSGISGIGPSDIESQIAFQSPRRSDPGLNLLELAITSGQEHVTPETPIQILTAIPHAPGQSIVPMIFDGGRHLPLGRGEMRDGFEVILVERLPVIDKDQNSRTNIKIHLQRLDTEEVSKSDSWPS